MSEFEVAVVGCIIFAAGFTLIGCLVAALSYIHATKKSRRSSPLLGDPPLVAVWMPIRNGGPDLREAIVHLLAMDYPRIEVLAVIDNPADPAVPVVAELERFDARLSHVFLDKSAIHRSLFNSSLVQFFELLESRCGLLVSCCADMRLPSNYFRNQAAAMSDPAIGCTLGNRWYQPSAQGWGGVYRYLYNTVAVLVMWLFRIPWGGAIALRPEDVRRSGLFEAWQNGMVDDAPIPRAFRSIGKRLAFVPELLVFEPGPITTSACFNFLQRQLLWTRLHNPSWNLIFALILLVLLGYAAAAALVIVAVWQGRYAVLGWSTAALVALWCGAFAVVLLLEQNARRIIRNNGQSVTRWSLGAAVKVFLGIFPAFVFVAAAMTRAHFARQINWSGVVYRIGGPADIEILQDRPDNP